jgi:hypothetical protein
VHPLLLGKRANDISVTPSAFQRFGGYMCFCIRDAFPQFLQISHSVFVQDVLQEFSQKST